MQQQRPTKTNENQQRPTKTSDDDNVNNQPNAAFDLTGSFQQIEDNHI
jgi:hypothetical protein